MIKDNYREEKNLDVYHDSSQGSYSDDYVSCLENKLQFLQSCVVESVCKHCNNKLCDSQTFNQQCFKCGKKPL